MAGSLLLYLGLCCAAAGLVAVVRPIAWLRLPTRGRAAIALTSGVGLMLTGLLWPAPESRIHSPITRLDSFMPRWHFSEFHATRVNAPPAVVFRAVLETTADEIRLFRTLTAIRRFGRPGPESILNAPGRQPILEVATRGGFVLLAEEVNREIVVGVVVAAPPQVRAVGRLTPETFVGLDDRAGVAKATMNFLLAPDGTDRTVLSTETRVFATDASAKHRFGPYWRTIYPGSSIIRYMWLRAVRLRAEQEWKRVPSHR
jgi:hypothetical protein